MHKIERRGFLASLLAALFGPWLARPRRGHVVRKVEFHGVSVVRVQPSKFTILDGHNRWLAFQRLAAKYALPIEQSQKLTAYQLKILEEV